MGILIMLDAGETGQKLESHIRPGIIILEFESLF